MGHTSDIKAVRTYTCGGETIWKRQKLSKAIRREPEQSACVYEEKKGVAEKTREKNSAQMQQGDKKSSR